MIDSRSKRNVNLKEFSDTGVPKKIAPISLNCPESRQYILRMPIRVDGGDYHIPAELSWTRQLFYASLSSQRRMGTDHPFVYITIRNGLVDSVTDDEWHLDGFSTKIPHVPEQNYIWCSECGTEYVPLKVDFPKDFNPLIHNINHYLTQFVDSRMIQQCEAQTLYCMDPYILHRRPSITTNQFRTFVRISFVPIEINDINNTQNPALPRVYSQDGVAFRNKLLNY